MTLNIQYSESRLKIFEAEEKVNLCNAISKTILGSSDG